LFNEENIETPSLKNLQRGPAKSRAGSANNGLQAQMSQNEAGRKIAIALREITGVLNFVSGAQSARFAFPSMFCWKAARKYQGGRAQEVVLSESHWRVFVNG